MDLDLHYDSDTCEFCGRKKEPFSAAGRGYSVCKCEEAQANLEKVKEATFAIQDMKIKMELCDTQIENERKKSQRLVRETLGRRFGNRTFETFKSTEENAKALEKCLNYASHFDKNEGEGLVLYGSVGTGKTHLVAAMTHRIIDEFGVPVVLKTAIEMFTELKNFEDSSAILKYKTCDLLIIDDLGKEKITEWNREKLFEIINFRYEEYLPTVVTTNLPPREWEDNFGEATFSRLCEGGKIIGLVGKDKRKESFNK